VKISVHQTEHEIAPEEACGGGHQIEKQCDFQKMKKYHPADRDRYKRHKPFCAQTKESETPDA
jgi:hypothetical protein